MSKQPSKHFITAAADNDIKCSKADFLAWLESSTQKIEAYNNAIKDSKFPRTLHINPEMSDENSRRPFDAFIRISKQKYVHPQPSAPAYPESLIDKFFDKILPKEEETEPKPRKTSDIIQISFTEKTGIEIRLKTEGSWQKISKQTAEEIIDELIKSPKSDIQPQQHPIAQK